MKFRHVDSAALFPHHCAAIPFLGNSSARAGFIDTGMEIRGVDPHIYISMEAAQEIAKFIGWSGPSTARGLQGEVARLTAELDQVIAERDAAQQYIDSIEYVARGPMKPYKKSGRPKKEANA